MLNIYSTAPIWRTYFETLGLKSENVVFSDYTSEELWAEGGKYGSIDPCYPSKVCQAHIHNLLFKKPRNRFSYIFFPCITHVPSFVVNTMDNTSCPIVVPLGFLELTLAIVSLLLPPFYSGMCVFSGDYFLAALVATGWLIWLRFASWVLKPVLEDWRDDG